MVQVLPQVAKKPNPFNRGLEMAMQLAGNYQQKGQQEEAAKKLGLDPSVFSLPEQAQAEYFKNQFAQEKPLTALQQSQMKLNEEKLNALKNQQNLFQQLRSGQTGQQPPGQPQNQLQDQDILSSISEDKLDQFAAFAGQPGEMGIIGNMFKAEKEKRNETEKLSREEKIQKRKEDVKFHEGSLKYHEELLEKNKTAKRQIQVIQDTRKAIQEGKSTPSSLANIFKGFGEVGDKLSNALLKKDQVAIMSAVPEFLEGRKELFGVRLSDADLRLLQDKLPDIGKSKDVNEQILNMMEKYGRLSTLRYKIGADIQKKNKGLRPLGYADLIEEKYDEMTRPVKIINPNTGREIEIPEFELADALKSGATLVHD